jgi:hypothetical protein
VKPTRDVEARRVREPTNEQSPLVQLRLHGRDAGPPIDGATIERAFRLDDGRYLILLTDDVPYEEALRVYLLDQDGTVLDGIVLGSAYVTGSVQDVTIENDVTLAFSFVHRARCRVSVRGTGAVRLPLRYKPGVARIGPLWRRRFLDVSFEEPRPAES